ncbi:hypothetical protein HGD90_04895 [Rhodobacteraceae bacterium R_SAG7]|nr:hypothetical protein [Rhodobacteraceae bacterium R_SAG7]
MNDDKKRIRKRIIVISLFVVTILLGNAIHSILTPTKARDHDKAYIGKNCVGISEDQALNIAKHITSDGTFGGTWYIFNQTPGQFSDGDFEAAWRPMFSEVLCFPIAGCVIPPSLRNDCLAE